MQTPGADGVPTPGTPTPDKADFILASPPFHPGALQSAAWPAPGSAGAAPGAIVGAPKGLKTRTLQGWPHDSPGCSVSGTRGTFHPGPTTGARPSLCKFRPDLPAEVDGWVELALALDREQRFANVRALWTAPR